VYIRFVSLELDPESRQLQGILRAANALVLKRDLSEVDEKYIEEMFDWFNDNLKVPTLRDNEIKAVFWFVGNATEHIKRMWQLTNIMRSHGSEIEVRICRTLYNICYRDECQVAALPCPNNIGLTQTPLVWWAI